MDRLTATKVFVTVVDQGSLTLAAECLEMNAAMVSRYLAALESWMKVRLLHRTTRKISLTEAGDAALESCRQLLRISENLEANTLGLSQSPRGRLRIATPHLFGKLILTPALVGFQKRFPEIELSIVASNITLDMTQDRLDLSICISDLLEPNLIAKRLGTWPLMICATPAYLREHGTPSSVEDLHQHAFITHSQLTVGKRRLRLNGRELDFPLRQRFTANEAGIILAAVLEGAGLAILPEAYIQRELAEGRLVRVLPGVAPDPLEFHAVYLSRQHQPMALKELIQYLSEHFAHDGEAA
ncbi:LysR family transcriptional regulator [Herbaspirillum huttiense]|uniref:LysR family transcriptional regulator n=1 Tax=Herbaspirillum huttiense TaxID=863372 RepID=UPI000584C37F|nr:LysR family transcriptional regulator [Herbaspirillum huttiense]MBN9358389.1 LysR family transcriptional regulator [Herbaspirillum huttiense]